MQLAVEGSKLYKLSSQESKSSNSFLEQGYNHATSSSCELLSQDHLIFYLWHQAESLSEPEHESLEPPLLFWSGLNFDDPLRSGAKH